MGGGVASPPDSVYTCNVRIEIGAQPVMITIRLPLKDIVIDPSRDVDLGQYTENSVVSPQLNCGRTNLHKIRHAACGKLGDSSAEHSGAW